MAEAKKGLVWISRIVLVLALILIGYFVAMTVIIPVNRFKIVIPELKKPGTKKTAYQPDMNWQIAVPDSMKDRVVSLYSREAFLLSKLEMTESDSVNLAISLKDSSVSLVMAGVTIYSSKIQEYGLSNVFRNTDPFGLTRWLSKPFVVDTFYASIAKVPIIYKKAPKDTIEAMSQSALDTLKGDPGPVHFTLFLDRKLKITLLQSEEPLKGYMKEFKVYRRQLREIERRNIISHLIRFAPVEFIPEIRIVIDKKSARVIYRAIPAHSLVALQI